MKLLVITCVKEYCEDVFKIFKQAEIKVFSTNDIIGHKDSGPENLLADWFASGDEQFDSMIIFSFTGNANAEHGMELIKNYNAKMKQGFPVRAFLVPVEKSV
jgi:hypothetical protein